MSRCPDCSGDLQVGPGLEKGEIVICPECGAELEVQQTSPLRLRPVPDEDAEED